MIKRRASARLRTGSELYQAQIDWFVLFRKKIERLHEVCQISERYLNFTAAHIRNRGRYCERYGVPLTIRLLFIPDLANDLGKGVFDFQLVRIARHFFTYVEFCAFGI